LPRNSARRERARDDESSIRVVHAWMSVVSTT
jgi:hypothetical protein